MTLWRVFKHLLGLPPAMLLALVCLVAEYIGDKAGDAAAWLARWIEK